MTAPAFRRFTPVLLLTLLFSLLATPAWATGDQNPTSDSNPDLENACGLDFMLVIDRSGSVAPSASQAKAAAGSFLSALVDTGSKASVVSFADGATVNQSPASLTSGNLGSFTSAVNGLSFSGGTNWEAGLAAAYSQFGSYTGGAPDLVVVITDGNPNRWFDSHGDLTGDGNGFEQVAQNEAVLTANLMKAAGAHVFALGVDGTDDLRESALKAISGNDEWTGGAFGSADWSKVTSYSNLQTKLAEMATALCQESVIVHKLLDGQPAAGWEFSAGDDSETTDTDGIATFSWTSPESVSIDLIESPQAGYELDAVECTLNDEPVGNPITGGMQLTVGPRDTIQCTFDNRTLDSAISVVKTADPMSASPGDSVTYHYVVTDTGETALSDVTLDDDILGLIGGPISLAAGESMAFDKQVTIEASSPTTNVVTAVGTDPRGHEVQAQDEVTITIVLAETADPPTTTTTTAPPTTTTTAAPVTTTTTAAPALTTTTIPTEVLGAQQTAPLPRTGGDIRGLLLAATVLVLAGLALVAGNRKAHKA